MCVCVLACVLRGVCVCVCVLVCGLVLHVCACAWCGLVLHLCVFGCVRVPFSVCILCNSCYGIQNAQRCGGAQRVPAVDVRGRVCAHRPALSVAAAHVSVHTDRVALARRCVQGGLLQDLMKEVQKMETEKEKSTDMEDFFELVRC